MVRPRYTQNEKGKGRASPIVRIAPYTPVFATAEASNLIDETSVSKESNQSGKKHSWDEIDVESTDNKSSKDRLTDFLLDDSGKYLRGCLSGKNTRTGRRTRNLLLHVMRKAEKHFIEMGVVKRTVPRLKTYYLQTMLKRYKEAYNVAHQSGEGALPSDEGSNGRKQFESKFTQAINVE